MIANTGLDLNVSSQFARHWERREENYFIVNCQIVVKKEKKKDGKENDVEIKKAWREKKMKTSI